MAKGARERSTILQFSKWRETGFLREFLVRGEDIGKNPVSEIVVARNRVFAKIFNRRRRYRKKPGF